MPAHGDADFGGHPVLIDAGGCPPLLAVAHKAGAILLYDRRRLAHGPLQRLQAGDPKSPGELLGSDDARHPSALPQRLHEGVPAPVRMPGRPQRVMYGPERDVHAGSRSGDQYPTTSPSGEPKRSHRLMNLFQD